MATLPSTGWSAPASGPKTRRSRRPASAVKKTLHAQGPRRHDPAPANPLHHLFLRRKHPRLHADEKGIRPQIKMVPPSESVARPWVSRGGKGLWGQIQHKSAAQKAEEV